MDFEEHLLYETTLNPKIRNFVLERDDWKCRACNSDEGLAIHHISFRSSGRDHSPENLVSLCFNHHRMIHDGKLRVVVVNGNYFFGGIGRLKC